MRKLLSGFIDGELSPPEVFSLRSHVQGCLECQRTLGHLRRLKATAAELEDVEPPSDLWQRTMVRLDQDPEQRRWLFPMMTGAVAVAASVAGFVFWTVSAQTLSVATKGVVPAQAVAVSTSDVQFHAAEQHYRASVRSLRQIAARESAAWPTAQRERFDRDLGLFERAVERSREAARLSGLDPRTRELYLATYRQQIRYLQEAILSGVVDAPSLQRRDGRDLGGGASSAMPASWQP